MIFAREIGHFLIFGVLLVDGNWFELENFKNLVLLDK